MLTVNNFILFQALPARRFYIIVLSEQATRETKPPRHLYAGTAPREHESCCKPLDVVASSLAVAYRQHATTAEQVGSTAYTGGGSLRSLTVRGGPPPRYSRDNRLFWSVSRLFSISSLEVYIVHFFDTYTVICENTRQCGIRLGR